MGQDGRLANRPSTAGGSFAFTQSSLSTPSRSHRPHLYSPNGGGGYKASQAEPQFTMATLRVVKKDGRGRTKGKSPAGSQLIKDPLGGREYTNIYNPGMKVFKNMKTLEKIELGMLQTMDLGSQLHTATGKDVLQNVMMMPSSKHQTPHHHPEILSSADDMETMEAWRRNKTLRMNPFVFDLN